MIQRSTARLSTPQPQRDLSRKKGACWVIQYIGEFGLIRWNLKYKQHIYFRKCSHGTWTYKDNTSIVHSSWGSMLVKLSEQNCFSYLCPTSVIHLPKPLSFIFLLWDLIFYDIFERQKYYCTIIKMHLEINSCRIGSVLWYGVWRWWECRVVLTRCRRRTGLTRECRFTVPELKQTCLLREMFQKWRRIFLPDLCGSASYGIYDLGLRERPMRRKKKHNLIWVY